jgi:PAS domain S-box-containing protein
MATPGDPARFEAEVRRLETELAAVRAAHCRLQEREAQYRHLTELSKAGICIIYDRTLHYVNNRLCEMLMRPRETLLGRFFEEFVPPDQSTAVAVLRERFDAQEALDQCFETAVVASDGRRIEVELSLTVTPFEGRRAAMVLVYDVGARIRAEARIRQLTQQLMRAQENERLNISRHLHDHVAQDLSSLKILCATLLDGEDEVGARLKPRMEQMTARLQGAIDAVRALAYDLRPPGLDQLGLERTLLHDCQSFSLVNGIAVDFSALGVQGLKLSADLEINLYRVFQEALNNIRRHAAATRVTVRLVASSPYIVLRIQDNGRGFDFSERLETAREQRRMGLQSMDERARLLGGRLRITTRPGKGTRLYLEAPLASSDSFLMPERSGTP